MESFFLNIGEKGFRAKQILQWVYQRNTISYSEMTDFSKTLREKLNSLSNLSMPEVASEQRSVDGTVKWLFRLHDGNCIETVYIPEADRGTLCISSQVGCGLNCTFCSTARQGFNRNPDIGEIISQLWLANTLLEKMELSEGQIFQRHDNDQRRPVTNVVMMGMGEPLLNYDNVVAAMKLMMDDFAFGLSRRRVTLSTAGMVPMIDRLKIDCPVSLAVSLHAPNDELRDKLVPLNKKYPIAELLDSCKNYVDRNNRQRVTFEYVMLKGINDSAFHAKQLGYLLKEVPSKVNLIPFNRFPETQFERSSNNAIHRFSEVLQKMNIFTITRKTRGDDIDAACGQLAGDFVDRTKRSTRMKQMEVTFS